MKDFDEIIRERLARLPLDQVTEEPLRTIIEILTTQPDVPLAGMARIFVALQLERLLPPKEQAERERRRLLRSIENGLVIAKGVRKILPRSSKGKPRPTALEAVRESIFKDPFRDPDDPRSRFPTVEALQQFLKRERDARKKSQR